MRASKPAKPCVGLLLLAGGLAGTILTGVVLEGCLGSRRRAGRAGPSIDAEVERLWRNYQQRLLKTQEGRRK